MFYPITNCYQLITSLITDRLYDLRVSYQRIENFKKLLKEFFKKYFIQNQQVDNTTNIKADIQNIVFTAIDLEKSLKNELSIQPIYLVTAKRGYDVNLLTSYPAVIFPGLLEKFPDLEYDSFSLAFSLPSACIFHLMKILEFLAREYYRVVVPTKDLPERGQGLGLYLSNIPKNDNNKRLIALLTSIKDNIRNPIIHPDIKIDIYEAIAILGSALEVIGLLLKELSKS